MDNDMAKVCRLCMEVLDLNHTMEDSATLQMVEDCLQLTFMFVQPLLTAEICDDCYYKIKDFSEFKENCHAMQDLLLQDVENYESANCTEKEKMEEMEERDNKTELPEPTNDEDAKNQTPREPPVILNSILATNNSRAASVDRMAASYDSVEPKKVEHINVLLSSDKANLIIINQHVYNECNVCYKSYNNLDQLKRHLHTHAKKRTYLCEYCPMTFLQKSSLRSHIRTHTKEKPYVCAHCGIAYGYYQLLKKHLSRYHATAEERVASHLSAQ